jgi:hypothetical protein
MKLLHQEKRPNFPLNAAGVTASSASRHLCLSQCLYLSNLKMTRKGQP